MASTPWGAQNEKRSQNIKNDKFKNARQEYKRFRSPSVALMTAPLSLALVSPR